MDKNLEIDSKKIGKFIKGLTEAEFRYIEITIGFVGGIKDLIKTFKLDKEAIVDLFHLRPKDYNKYIGGNYNYNLKEIAMLKS
ncbi:MAG: hypothetical protein PF487_08290 [Bacteroidales bacterium]|jgi:hypothetical protein|nr:hypothetical protein [Bacteroidales bacterium]